MNTLKFPKNFYWGAGTSAHQVEGGNDNDWTDWEKENAVRLAKSAARKYSKVVPDWNGIKMQATDPGNYISGRACDHYALFESDFDIMESLGFNAYRFSVEWSRVEPVKGRFDNRALAHYKSMVDSLKDRGIEPFVTFNHVTLPKWFRDLGGWDSKSAPVLFSRYVKRVVKILRGVKFWLTINEPIITISNYLLGIFPPQKKSVFSCFRAFNNIVASHKMAYAVIKKLNKNSQVSIVSHITFFEAYKNRLFNCLVASSLNYLWNFRLLDKLSGYMDFIGVNYYFHTRINYGVSWCDNPVSDMGWALCPEGIYFILKALKKYNLPIIITENGLADARDKYRSWYIHGILKSVHRAISEGVDVRGYLHWSLLDNFEVDKGFWPRFGLVEVNYKTLKRIIRPSAVKYSDIIKANSIVLE